MKSREVILLSVAVASAWLVSCKPHETEDPRVRPRLVSLEAVKPSHGAVRSFTGTVTARTQSGLGFRVGGKIVTRRVDTGERVTKGQKLMELDDVDLKLAVEARRAAVDAARARTIEATADEKRHAALLEERAVSRKTYDSAKAAYDSAVALEQAAQAQLNLANHELAYSVLLADRDGVVVGTLGEPGQVVAAGEVVVYLANSEQREAKVHLPENFRPPLNSAAEVALYAAREKRSYAAKLRELSDSADAATRTYEARYVLEGDAATAPLGSTVTVTPDEEGEGDSSVPLGAVIDRGQGPGVWAFNEGASTVSFKPVKLLRLEQEEAVIGAGLDAGLRVVAMGAHLLEDGEVVRVNGNHGKEGDR